MAGRDTTLRSQYKAIVRNTVGISTCHDGGDCTMRYFWQKAYTPKPRSFFDAGTDDLWYWPLDAFLDGKTLFVSLLAVRNKPNAGATDAFGFEIAGTKLATNTVVVNFEQLATCIRLDAIDVILLDTTFWGGLRQAWKAGVVCEKFQRGVSVHSSGELGIQLATMLHLGAALPNLTFASDAHYHHLTDDILKGGKLEYSNGEIAVPKGHGLGVELDRGKMQEYAEFFKRTSGYMYDRDPQRPEWFAVVPEGRFAQPKNRRRPS